MLKVGLERGSYRVWDASEAQRLAKKNCAWMGIDGDGFVVVAR